MPQFLSAYTPAAVLLRPLHVEPDSGSSTGQVDEVAISIDISGLTEVDTYNCDLTISDPSAENNPLTFIVTLYLRDSDSQLFVPSEYGTIQGAIDLAGDGDTVFVEQGTYYENINFNGRAITVRSMDPLDVATTIIDAQGSGSVVMFANNEGPQSVLSGLTITGGAAEYGGGIYCCYANGCDEYCEGSSPTITNCVITGNTATKNGGGMYNYNGSPILINCTFSGNTAVTRGGGVYNRGCSPSLLYCTLNNHAMMTNCTFSENSASIGGGLCNQNISLTLMKCIFNGNSSARAGGIYNNNVPDKLGNFTILTSCVFIGNIASTQGGGMFSTDDSFPVLTNCTFIMNSAGWIGGIECEEYGFGGGSIPTLTNCIL